MAIDLTFWKSLERRFDGIPPCDMVTCSCGWSGKVSECHSEWEYESWEISQKYLVDYCPICEDGELDYFYSTEELQEEANRAMDRKNFRLHVLGRDKYKCVVCGSCRSLCPHHLLERRLFAKDEHFGYIPDNGVTVCNEHHLEAEQTIISVQELRDRAGIRDMIVPQCLDPDKIYDKWGNEILENGRRKKGPLFDDESVQKVLKDILHLFD